MYIQLNSQIISYKHVGQGKSLILLHGNGGDYAMYEELMAALQDEYDIYALDSRGHGGSATPSEFHYQDMADDVINFIKAVEIKKPAILGFSDGAIVAMLLGIKEPHLTSHMILCGGNLSPKGLDGKTQRIIKSNYKKTKDPLQKLMLDEPHIDPEQLYIIGCPCLVTVGEKDCIRKKETQLITKSLQNATLKVLPGEDHISYLVHTDKFAPYVREFIH